MAKAKHVHTLTINKVGKNSIKYTYDFSNTKGITLLLSQTGFSISVHLTKIYDRKEMLCGDSYLFPDAIKKALLLYLIKYGKALLIQSITTKIDDEEDTEVFGKKAKPPIYSMINGELPRKIPKIFSTDTVFNYLLKTPKSKYDKRISALFALLCSKSKEYETERFIYLWMSFNGMYGFLSDFTKEFEKTKKRISENEQIKHLQKYLQCVGCDIVRQDDKMSIANNVVAILKDVQVEKFSKENISKGLSEKIVLVLKRSTGEKYNLTAYGYLLTQFSYYFRCKIIHGSKPIFLFSYTDDNELHSIKIINDLLEEFIDNNLALWFDDKYVNENIISKIKDILTKK